MTEKELDMILNTCLNDAMCKVGRIKKPNSNNIAEFVTNWMQVKKLNIDDVSESLEIPDIRNKLSPITHLIWCAENERGQKHIEKAIPQAKKSVNYLAQREVYSR